MKIRATVHASDRARKNESNPRFDPMWETCGSLDVPVAIHLSKPEAFFLPKDRFNERFEELNNHPNWSLHGRDFPSTSELLEARNRVLARHPKTQFIVLHVGKNAENLPYVSKCMDRYPNMTVELAARIRELGRQVGLGWERISTLCFPAKNGPHIAVFPDRDGTPGWRFRLTRDLA